MNVDSSYSGHRQGRRQRTPSPLSMEGHQNHCLMTKAFLQTPGWHKRRGVGQWIICAIWQVEEPESETESKLDSEQKPLSGSEEAES